LQALSTVFMIATSVTEPGIIPAKVSYLIALLLKRSIKEMLKSKSTPSTYLSTQKKIEDFI
jgi:hypothetical protein